MLSGETAPSTKIQPAHESPPAIITTSAIRTYDLKFFLKFPKKLGPAINPTDVTNRISPIFSTILSAFFTYESSPTMRFELRLS